jgi:heme-degrading monooxygenase HmoA
MTTIGMHYNVIPGKESEFERGFEAVLNHLKNSPGHLDSHLYQDVHSPGSYLILSNWTDRESFDAFIHSPAFASVAQWGKSQILRSRPQHTVYTSDNA